MVVITDVLAWLGAMHLMKHGLMLWILDRYLQTLQKLTLIGGPSALKAISCQGTGGWTRVKLTQEPQSALTLHKSGQCSGAKVDVTHGWMIKLCADGQMCSEGVQRDPERNVYLFR